MGISTASSACSSGTMVNAPGASKARSGNTKSFTRTLWLFTYSDLKTVVLPQLTFSLANNLSIYILPNRSPPLSTDILPRMLLAVVWIWIHLLIEVISNQRLPESVIEDRKNKPWRPLPSKRITSKDARRLVLCCVPLAIGISILLNVTEQSIVLMVLTWLYNDLGGADEHFIVRNLLNAAGLLSFGCGATFILSGPSERRLTRCGLGWFSMIAAVIITTVHIQDLPDMVGDAARGRHTVPLVYGSSVARFSAAGFVLLWTTAVPWYWKASPLATSPILICGVALAAMIGWESPRSDRAAWVLWCIWMMTLFTLPSVA